MNTWQPLGRAIASAACMIALTLACSSTHEDEDIGVAHEALSSTGGSKATGGAKSTGGKSSTGGAKTGGAPATGGKATGGKSGTGGAKTGGAPATGGKTAIACSPPDCNDNNACTTDTCNAGACVHTAVANGTTCSDGNACTRTDSCQSGTCVGSNPVTCTASDACHLTGTCNTATGLCTNPEAPVGTPCSDSNVCTVGDVCMSGQCQSGNPIPSVSIDDGDPCTLEGCDPIKGVSHMPITDNPVCAKWYSGGLKVEIRTNYCDTQKAQQYFQVTNTGTAPVNLSDITIKYWVGNTTGASVVSDIYYAGCVVTSPSNPTCLHPVSGVSATGTAVANCNADNSANWEVAIATTDSAQLQPGQQWNNLQTVVHLNNWANFVPGTSQWYSTCLTNSNFASDPHFAVYYKGNLVFNSGINAPACAAPRGSQPLSGHITADMAAAPLVGPVPASSRIDLSIGLPVRIPADSAIPDLATFVDQVSDPNSPQYRHYMDLATFKNAYGALDADIAAVQGWATSHGLTVTHTYGSNLLINVAGTALAVEQALHVNLNYYLRPDGSRFYAPDREPSVDTASSLLYVGHLNDMFVPKRAADAGGTGTAGALLGDDVRRLYASDPTTGVQTQLTGNGECVGIIMERGGFALPDIQTYWDAAKFAAMGDPTSPRRTLDMPSITAAFQSWTEDNFTFAAGSLPPVRCKTKDPNTGQPYRCGTPEACGTLGCSWLSEGQSICGVDGPGAQICYTTCPSSYGCDITGSLCPSKAIDAIEIEMDIEMVLAMAPAANIVVYEGKDDESNLAEATTAISPCRQLSKSSSADMNPNIQQLLRQLAAQGQSIFLSSGDGGEQFIEGAVITPYATAVGGTQLFFDSNSGRYSEGVWPEAGGGVANGHTNSCNLPHPLGALPPYQNGVQGVISGGRNIPDVAMLASDLERVTMGTRDGNGGGTSTAAPLWAGFMALINEQNRTNLLQPTGLANPALYAIARTDAYSQAFHDIGPGLTADNNYIYSYSYDSSTHACTLGPNAAYRATVGYDQASGLGSPTLQLINQLASTSPVPPLAVATGVAHACALRGDSSIWCWGSNAFGQLGNGTHDINVCPSVIPSCPPGVPCCIPPSVAHSPTKVSLDYGQNLVTSLSAGAYETCAVLATNSTNGTVWCWGTQVGLTSPINYGPTPILVTGVTSALQVAAGYYADCALVNGGAIKCWGSNLNGQLGDGSDTNTSASISSPATASIDNAVSVRSGLYSTCALTATGSVRCWGDNSHGQLGDGSTENSSAPGVVGYPAMSDAVDLTVGAYHACALRANGEVVCWGANANGQLGDGTTNDKAFPVTVQGLGHAVVQIAAAQDNTCAILSDGTVTCWGSNVACELGNGDTDTSHQLLTAGQSVASLKGARNGVPPYLQYISGGAAFNCAITNNSVACWGYDGDGAMGDGRNGPNQCTATPVHF
jgi:alpha-tubulin suppressor-like RCC1 family protein